jgi:L-rhamnose mutarotase
MKRYKRFCKTLQLIDDAALIEEYKKFHAAGNGWPEIKAGLKEIGVIDMDIYLDGTTLFMIMDTEENFDHDTAMEKLATLPRQAEWEATVSKYQKTSVSASAKEKWRLIDRIFSLEE